MDGTDIRLITEHRSYGKDATMTRRQVQLILATGLVALLSIGSVATVGAQDGFFDSCD